MAGSEVVPVSAPGGLGLQKLTRRLDDLVDDDEPTQGPRLWIDRRFTVDGAGTVVTGTLLGGRLTVGDTLVCYPSGRPVRVRGLESHEQATDRVLPRRRVAVNLVGAPDDLGRGDMLGESGKWDTTDRFTADLVKARYVDELTAKGAYHLHTGSSIRPVRVRFVSDGTLMQVDRPLPLRYGDRFILRETGRRAVVAGGTVLDPRPPRRGRPLAAATSLARGLEPPRAADALLALRGSETLARLAADTGGAPSDAVVVGDIALTEDSLADLMARAVEIVDHFHAEAPLRAGVPFATLVSRLRQTPAVTRYVVDHNDDLVTDGPVIWKTGRRASLTAEQEDSWLQTKGMLAEAGFSPPKASDLPVDREVLHQMIRKGELVSISEEYVYLASDVEVLRTAILAMPPEFTVADFRDAMGLSRRHAVPILEWADAQGLTRRSGDHRHPVNRPTNEGL
ncbi:selenocysteine-specific translation elongation factor [soil metagenome]